MPELDPAPTVFDLFLELQELDPERFSRYGWQKVLKSPNHTEREIVMMSEG